MNRLVLAGLAPVIGALGIWLGQEVGTRVYYDVCVPDTPIVLAQVTAKQVRTGKGGPIHCIKLRTSAYIGSCWDVSRAEYHSIAVGDSVEARLAGSDLEPLMGTATRRADRLTALAFSAFCVMLAGLLTWKAAFPVGRTRDDLTEVD